MRLLLGYLLCLSMSVFAQQQPPANVHEHAIKMLGDYEKSISTLALYDKAPLYTFKSDGSNQSFTVNWDFTISLHNMTMEDAVLIMSAISLTDTSLASTVAGDTSAAALLSKPMYRPRGKITKRVLKPKH